jgi:hypothetical protein
MEREVGSENLVVAPEIGYTKRVFAGSQTPNFLSSRQQTSLE